MALFLVFWYKFGLSDGSAADVLIDDDVCVAGCTEKEGSSMTILLIVCSIERFSISANVVNPAGSK